MTTCCSENNLQRSIHVLGAPRSGTTQWAGILSRHPQLAYVGEPRLLWRYGNDGKSDMLNANDARPELVTAIRSAFARQVRERNAERLLEKLPDNSLRMGFIDAVMPSPIFLHTVRNGVDSVLSIKDYWTRSGGSLRKVRWRKRLKEMRLRQMPHYAREVIRRAVPAAMHNRVETWTWGPRIPGIHQMRRELDLIDICCLQWRMCVEAACQYGRSLPPERYFELKIETLDERKLDEVLAFTGLSEPEADAVREGYATRLRSPMAGVGRRAATADAAEIARIRRWIEPTMNWLGYDFPPSRQDGAR